jgi:hypothetical protein
MENRITLITPPDVYENSNKSLLFINIGDKDQEAASRWLATQELKNNLNFYIYSGEPNVSWLLHASSIASLKYIDLDNLSELSMLMCSYLLSKNNFYYKTDNENLAAIYGHINTNRVSTIEQFLEKVFSDEIN